MARHSHTMNVDELMTEMGWVRRLARSLVGPDAADDITQDAYLIASERAPEDGRPLRPWLHRVVTNLVRMRHRSGTRREARELATASTSVATPDQLVERVEAQRALADEVLALREPYRSTILLHYVEGLSSADIARQLGIPSATVRQRLKHALDELRDRLAKRDPKHSWLLALVPMAKVNPPLAVGVLVMKKILVAVAVLVFLLVGGGLVWKLTMPASDSSSEKPIASAGAVSAHTGLSTTIAGKDIDVPAWVVLPHAPKRHLAGRVVANGAPVPHAIVRIGIHLSNPRIGAPEMTSGPPFVQVGKREAGQDGMFDFGMVPAANYVVSGESEGKAPTSVSVMAGDPKANTDHVVIALGDCRSRVVGTVRDSASPIAHARLLIAGLAGSESDAKGAFTVCMPMTQFPNIRVEADGYGSIDVQVPSMTGLLRRDFILVPEATISGIVVDNVGAGVAGAVVAARPALADAQDEASPMETIADATGHFTLVQLAPSKYGLGAFTADGVSDHAVVVASAGHATKDVKLTIESRAQLRGHVVMAGKPVAGAFVGAERSPYMRFSPHYAESQADGSFVLDGIALGPADLSAYPYEVVSPKSFEVKAGTDVTIEVKEQASIVGKLTRHGVPVPNATVTVSPINSIERSNADGMYEIVGLTPGTFTLTATDNRAFTNHVATVTSGQRQTIDLELDGGGEVLGTVLDEAGQPVPSVMVHLDSTDNEDSCGAFTDEHGNFDCAALAGHLDYLPKVYASVNTSNSDGFSPANGTRKFPLVHVQDGDTVVRDVKLVIKHEMITIRGRVVDDTGLTVSDARVSMPNSEWGDGVRTRADDDGGFILENLAISNWYDLRARTSDGATGEALHVKPNATNVEIKLIRPGSIAGTLVGFTGTISVLAGKATYGQDDTYEAKIDGDHFSITGLQPGNYTVAASRDGAQLDGTTVDIKSGTVSTITFHARDRARVDGRITDLETGVPIAGMACRATLALGGREGPITGNEISKQLTDATGTFSLDSPTGHVRVSCLYAGGAHSHSGGEFEITSGANHVELTSAANHLPDGFPGFNFQPWLIPPTVLRNGPRARALGGIEVGDQIVSVDGIDTSNMIGDEVQMLITSKGPGVTVTIKLARGTVVKVPLIAGD